MCSYRSRLVFNCCFKDTEISQGSVATQLRCGAIFSDSIITNVLLVLTVNKFENRSIFDSYGVQNKVFHFFDHPVCSLFRHVNLVVEHFQNSSVETSFRQTLRRVARKQLQWPSCDFLFDFW